MPGASLNVLSPQESATGGGLLGVGFSFEPEGGVGVVGSLRESLAAGSSFKCIDKIGALHPTCFDAERNIVIRRDFLVRFHWRQRLDVGSAGFALPPFMGVVGG